MLRSFLFASCAAMCAGCASEAKLPSGLPPMMLIGGPQAADVEPTATADDDHRRKSLAAKVLAARALERVTGAKPDPARLSELD